jgi:hypothetical protein
MSRFVRYLVALLLAVGVIAVAAGNTGTTSGFANSGKTVDPDWYVDWTP